MEEAKGEKPAEQPWAPLDVAHYRTAARPAETQGFIMQQTMFRVRDPVVSLNFYCNVLGMRLVMSRDFPEWGFSVYFVSPVDPGQIPEDKDE